VLQNPDQTRQLAVAAALRNEDAARTKNTAAVQQVP